ncbi:MAG TPA: antibiotic biosynthesis monooxygenase, partial [Bacteroidota bacterium]
MAAWPGLYKKKRIKRRRSTMHMRLLQLKINAHELQSFCRFYENRIMPALQTIGGCLHACLVQSTTDAGEVISLTLWQSEEHASTYERSGLFMKLVGEARPFFANTSEWKLQLSKDFTLEYAPDAPEPTLKSFSVSSSSAGQIPAGHRASQSFLRIVSVHLRPGKLQDYRDTYEREIIPALLSTHGCQFACLSTPTNE